LDARVLSNKSLSELDLSGNSIGTIGAISIVRAIMVSGTISRLTLLEIGIVEVGYSNLIEFLVAEEWME